LARLIILSQHEFAAPAMAPLRAAAPALELVLATTLAELEGALAQGTQNSRLVSFGSGDIVPVETLARLPGPSYNFHPGPPNYPGIFPSVFALYDGVSHFGVTLHEMAARVDSGPIVATETFAVPPNCDRLALDTAAFAALSKLLQTCAPALAEVAKPLAHAAQTWSGVRRTRKHFDALCRLPEDATAEEFARRLRVVGEGPDHALSMTRFGRTFKLVGDRRGDVVRGGQPINTA